MSDITCPKCKGKGKLLPPDHGKSTLELETFRCYRCGGKGTIPDSADLGPLSEPDQSSTAEPVETIPGSVSVTCRQCGGSGYGRDGGEACEVCEGNGVVPGEEPKITKVIPVAPGSKYVILIPTGTATETLMQLQDILVEWWRNDDDPFLIIGDQFEFVKVDDASESPPLASCGYTECPGHEPDSGDVCEELGDQVEMVT